jgi:hypothetical protein
MCPPRWTGSRASSSTWTSAGSCARCTAPLRTGRRPLRGRPLRPRPADSDPVARARRTGVLVSFPRHAAGASCRRPRALSPSDGPAKTPSRRATPTAATDAPGASAPAAAAAPALPPAAPSSWKVDRAWRANAAPARTERRWRMFFRLAWLGLALAVAWACSDPAHAPPRRTTPHTALVEVRGEIAPTPRPAPSCWWPR